MNPQSEFVFTATRTAPTTASPETLAEDLEQFREFGQPTQCSEIVGPNGTPLPVFTNEFWTSKQRAAHSLHEVSYRACFKPQLPRFFIERLTQPGDLVYDPFMGRGTTLVEAALLGRRAAGCDVNPLSRVFASARLQPPSLQDVEARLAQIDFAAADEIREDLKVFYHPETLREICALRSYCIQRRANESFDQVDAWIQMVATNRLTGHSTGFFSVYTLPPNQAVSIESQQKINARYQQQPPRRHVAKLILRKSRQLLADGPPPEVSAPLIVTGSSENTPQIADESVSLVVTSPPFLDIVDYAHDNWLRSWFCGIDARQVNIWTFRNVEDWTAAMTRTLKELYRVLRPGGHISFEVGEVRNGKVLLEHFAAEAGHAAGLDPMLVLINSQSFTKTANCWGVSNNSRGTNTNRVVVFTKR